jgi:hypothetical protein
LLATCGLKTGCAVDIHMSPEKPLRNHQPLAYQQAQVLAMRGGLKGNISSCLANPFYFQRLATKVFIQRLLA